MVALRRRMTRVARAERTTLIAGETGTGKEVVARQLHGASSRAGRPLVTVHCGALPETLIEAELFGHERGAFTGASSRRDGLIRRADGATLFLDEVNSLSPAAQTKLLRFLESGEYRAVGSDDCRRADVWVLAATNEDLQESVRRRRFRADLYHRLDVVRVELPPLRERGADVVLLAEHFLSAYGPQWTLTDRARRALRTHPWAGNVRELRNRVESATVLCDSHEIDVGDLGLHSGLCAVGAGGSSITGIEAGLWAMVEDDGMTLGEAVHTCEKMLIKQALEHEDHNRTRAADRLGIHVRTIFKKLAG